jgi:hypothetical protein
MSPPRAEGLREEPVTILRACVDTLLDCTVHTTPQNTHTHIKYATILTFLVTAIREMWLIFVGCKIFYNSHISSNCVAHRNSDSRRHAGGSVEDV